MLHVLILRYTVPEAQAEPHVPDHVEFLQRHHADGTFVFSGQTVPREIGGAILATGLDRSAVEKVAAADPLVVAGVGSYEAYRDMVRFTDHITSEPLRLRLLDALDGRGAFRRFRDIVFDGPAEVLTHWPIYRQERALGRARAWLASQGYRSAPGDR